MSPAGIGAAAALLAAVAVPAALLARWRARWRLINVRGNSMEPALHDCDRVLVDRRGAPRPGRIVVFAAPGCANDVDWLVKRVTATAGYSVPAEVRRRVAVPVVPPGYLVVRGDNPASRDSRHFGFVPVDTVLGTVVRVTARPLR